MNPFRSAAAVLALLFAGCISTVGEGGSGTGSGTPGSGATGAASTGAGAGGTATGATSSGQVGTSSGGGTSGGATTAGPTSGGSNGGPGSGGSTGGNCNADLQTDPDNCGACGNVCPMPCSPGPTCNAFQGVCANGVCG
ncbi:MAG TPA: hypothetical protein VMB50_03915, partial [Myxococcales bacterium]|nr:hypothetical protein [Myxococcales bacterium]